MSITRVYELINSAKVVENLSAIGEKLPTHESQTRPLARLEPPQQREAWTKAVEAAPNGKPTSFDAQRRPRPRWGRKRLGSGLDLI